MDLLNYTKLNNIYIYFILLTFNFMYMSVLPACVSVYRLYCIVLSAEARGGHYIEVSSYVCLSGKIS